MVLGPSRSQIACNPAESVVPAKLFDPGARGVTPMLAFGGPVVLPAGDAYALAADELERMPA